MAKSSILPIILLAGGAAVLLTMNKKKSPVINDPIRLSKISDNLYYLEGTQFDEKRPPAEPPFLNNYKKHALIVVRGSGNEIVGSKIKYAAAQMPDVSFTILSFDAMVELSKPAFKFSGMEYSEGFVNRNLMLPKDFAVVKSFISDYPSFYFPDPLNYKGSMIHPGMYDALQNYILPEPPYQADVLNNDSIFGMTEDQIVQFIKNQLSQWTSPGPTPGPIVPPPRPTPTPGPINPPPTPPPGPIVPPVPPVVFDPIPIRMPEPWLQNSVFDDEAIYPSLKAKNLVNENEYSRSGWLRDAIDVHEGMRGIAASDNLNVKVFGAALIRPDDTGMPEVGIFEIRKPLDDGSFRVSVVQPERFAVGRENVQYVYPANAFGGFIWFEGI
jgi:hypothetical protein